MFATAARLTNCVRYSYTGTPANENPFVDGGKFLNGATDGIDWNDVRAVNGALCPTAISGGPPYTDPTSLLQGTFRPNQRIRGKVKQINPQVDPIFQEVEFRFRSQLSAHVNAGYEMLFRAGVSNWYSSLVRWNGAVSTVAGGADGGFDELVHYTGAPSGIVDGDICEGYVIGSLFTAKVNGTTIWTYDTASDTAPTGVGAGRPARYLSGQPGIGLWQHGGTSGLLTDFGWYWVEISELP